MIGALRFVHGLALADLCGWFAKLQDLILILRSFEGTVYRYDNTGSQLFQVEINSAWLAKIPIADDDHTFDYEQCKFVVEDFKEKEQRQLWVLRCEKENN